MQDLNVIGNPKAAARVRRTREDKEARGECADCPLPAVIKPNGKRARLCAGHLAEDRARAALDRSVRDVGQST